MFSSIDPIISAILHSVIPMNCFSSRHSHIRQFKRKMLTCVRNRGIYNDIAYINLTKNIQTDYARIMAKNQPLFDRSVNVFQNFDNSLNENDHNKVYLQNQSPNYLLKYEEMRKLFETETQYSFDSVFTGISEKPSSVRNDFAEYDAILSTGEDVTITVIQPNILRLRNIDLFPIKVVHTFFDFFPFQTTWRSQFDYYLSRLSFDFEKEVCARQQLLKSYNIEFLNRTPKEIFNDVEQLNLPVYIPAPLKQFSSKHFMVTARKPSYFVRSLSAGNVNKLMKAASSFLFDKKFIIPDLSSSNLKIENEKIAIDRFYSMKQITNEELCGVSNLVAANAVQSTDLAQEAARLLKMNKNYFISHDAIDPIESIASRKMIKYHPDFAYGIAEMGMSLFGHLRMGGDLSENSIHDFSRPISQYAGLPNDQEVFSFLNRRSMQTKF